MDVTACVKRPLLALAGVVVGLVVAAPNFCFAEVGAGRTLSGEETRLLLDRQNGPVGIEALAGDSFDKFSISGDFGANGYKVSTLSNPDRVVIDLTGVKTQGSKVFDLAGSSCVSKVRLGSHSTDTRIVFDLVAGRQAAHDATFENGNLIVTLAEPQAMQTALKAGMPINLGEAMASPAIAPAVGAGSKDSKIAAPVMNSKGTTGPRLVNDSDEATDDAEAADSEAASDQRDHDSAHAAAKSARLTNINIEADNTNGNMVVAEATAPGLFTLKKTAPSEYTLRLRNTALDSNAAHAIIAPPQSGTIRSVRPVVDGQDIVLRIFATPGTELSARGQGNNVIVSTNGMALGTDMRAQAKPEAVEAAAKPAGKTEVIKGDGAKVEKTSPAATSEAAAPNTGGAPEDEFAGLLDKKYNGRLISLDLQDTDIDNALRIIAEVSNLNIIASEDVTGKVTLRLIDVPWDQALDVILKTNGLDKVQEGNVIRIAPVEKLRAEREALKQATQAEDELKALDVKYFRISYARASEMKPLVESVLSERGSVTYDERTNQLIVKDIDTGVLNAARLVTKLDLRTPQVLLETQIVEAQRTLARQLGAELGFTSIQSPETGNATGYNFPNSISITGSATGGNASSFPATFDQGAGSAVSFLLESADGAKSLNGRISALEKEGRIRVVSRPAVATTNNKQAVIKSVEKVRVKLPSGGTSVATGQGATASGGSSAATEVIEIGITLQVTPQASPDYYVLMDIDAKSSTFGSRVVDNIPSEVERKATSTVLVSSGQTFAMGGIYKISDNDTVQGVPFFKDIPFFGTFFRKQSVDNGDEELIFFITPRIVEGSFDDAAMKSAAS